MKYCPICDRKYDDSIQACELDGATLHTSRTKEDAFTDKIVRGRYRILRKLGEGGMGTVYLADQFAINRKVALKILNPDYARDEDFLKRFRQEATLAASLSHHNVVMVFDFDQADDGSLYIVMEYVDGRSLAEVIQNNPMVVDSAITLAIQIAEGLSAAHRAGVIHRDIKPENIMVVGGKTIKLMDFGIARLRDSAASTKLTQAGMIMGTPAYMAPEQIEGGELSDRTDIYAFGIVLYEMLTGYVPFKAPTPGAILVKHLHEIPIPLRRVRKEIPSSLEEIVVQALQKNPKKRLENMETVVEALKNAQREIAQSKFDEGEPRMVAMRRAFSAAALPFRKFFEKGTLSESKPTRKDQTEKNLDQSVSEEVGAPSALHQPTTGSDIGVTGATKFQAAPPEPAEDEPRLAAGHQEQSEKVRVSTPGRDTIAETVALSQPSTGQEQLIRGSERPVHYSRDYTDTSRRQTPTRTIEVPRTKLGAWPASSRQEDSDILPSPQRHKTPVFNRHTQREPQETATDITRSSTSYRTETIAETVTFTQPVERRTTRKKSWMVAASVSVSVIVIGVVGGLMVFRDIVVDPPVQNTETEPSVATETAVPPAQTEQPQLLTELPKEQAEQKLSEPTPTPAPEVKTKESPVFKESRVKEREIPLAKKTRETTSKRTDETTVKRAESTFAQETKPPEQTKTATVDQEQKPYQTPVSDPQLTKKSDATSKKVQDPGDQVASLNKPEAPSPSPIPVALKDLSIITNRRDLKVKERLPLSVRGRYSDGKESDITDRVQWRSSDSSIAFVNSRGELEALKEGKAQISATYDGVPSGTYTFNVRPSEETPKPEESREQIKDLRRRLLR